MIYHVFLRTSGKLGFGHPDQGPTRSISGDALEIIEWATFHNMKFVEKFADSDLRYEQGFATFTVQRADGHPLTDDEVQVFKKRTGHLSQGPPAPSIHAAKQHQNRLLGIADENIKTGSDMMDPVWRHLAKLKSPDQ